MPKTFLPWLAILAGIGTVALVSGLATYYFLSSRAIFSPLGKLYLPLLPDPLPLNAYTIENLSTRKIDPGTIVREALLEDNPLSQVFGFSLEVEGQKVSGQLHLPKSSPPAGGFPIIVMNRGFIEPETYRTGMGTKPAAGYFASHGYITLAPDFLGFGDSDPEDADPLAARVKKPLTTLTILASLDSLNQFTKADLGRVGQWGHSNGGQISLTVLTALSSSHSLNRSLPTTLWAPVSSAFPYNILHYTDDFDAVGKKLRQVLYNFELKYDTQLFSFHAYLDWINSPLQIHQGTADDFIPVSWSNRLTETLREKQKTVTLFTYPGADHNLKPNWEQVVERDLAFFKANL